ncbi:CRISPR-associated protein [Candidatus Jettenia caeni]|uniref:CRISPR-associated protein n=1 Tax=Candidatus Jettenia caeni TaxID=247490 RepID=I3IP72_9BACT|nr:type I-B CRISPR-associated protein Cas7/Cst2/DevR [Candidatus Jettenia sp. AMX1]WKZ15972.1 MAG: type I-B CRISPR-associated protein Cas7/Cst2/DevR [Candidatus Jettenia caeni]GAB63517.1 CRISPR-associated protein [Candidatus Jettenia caeni]GJQ44143.1 MAG: type I-B CRISPR-associated protein Cas7/Cst2/DevR [Ignavibacteriaceae bacterium]
MANLQNIKGINITWLATTDLTNLNSGEGGSNYVDVKKYKFQDKEYPYVSGQAMRYYLKEGIRRLRTTNDCCVPDDKGEACGNVTTCPLCDLFGFMATIKGEGAKVRVSPVKVSPAIGLLPFDANSTIDFLTRKKHKPEGEKASGDIVNVELGMNLYKGGISIDVAKVGFEEEYDETNKKMKFKDMRGGDDNEKGNETRNRIAQVLESLSFLSDYSKQARLLTDFTPDFIIISFQNNYSHRLQKALELKSDEEINLNTDRLKEILADISEYSNSIYVGMITGILDNEADVKKILSEKSIAIKTPNEAVKEAIKSIRGN